jgi:hypothetical protein
MAAMTVPGIETGTAGRPTGTALLLLLLAAVAQRGVAASSSSKGGRKSRRRTEMEISRTER